MQNPCFHEVTGEVALQNLQNKGVICKILQDKELRAVLVSLGRFRLKNDLDNWRKSLELIMRRSREMICKDWPSRRTALARH
jgi:hypothetical protein